jgi:hypothetical protein
VHMQCTTCGAGLWLLLVISSSLAKVTGLLRHMLLTHSLTFDDWVVQQRSALTVSPESATCCQQPTKAGAATGDAAHPSF